ncbi:MAG: hypothetical protein KDD53_08830, partial [Bdellovibrionales bacterium]|nr:hypothetical protein [Bdellovibrionales bacterium]
MSHRDLENEVDFVVVDQDTRGTIELATSDNRFRLFSRRSLPYLIAIVALLLVTISMTSFWNEIGKRFPLVPVGSYVGQIDGVFDSSTSFYIERSPASDSLLFIVFKSESEPVQIRIIPVESSGETEQWMNPLTVFTGDRKLKFVGYRTGSASFEGTVLDLDSQKEGEWRMHTLPASSQINLTAEDREDVRLWLMLQAELIAVESQISKAQVTIPEQESEIDKLNSYLTEGDELKSRAQERFEQAGRELEDKSAQLKIRQDTLRDLARQLEISEHVTGYGKLASLARKSIERENRWMTSMLGASEQMTPQFEQELQR